MSIDPAAVERTLRPLVDLLAAATTTDDLQAWMSEVADAAVPLLHVQAVGLLLLDEADAPHLTVSSDADADVVERAQLDCGEGPSIDTLRSGSATGMDDLTRTPRYPRLARQLASSPVRSVLASPVWVDGAMVGSLDTMLPVAHHWTTEETRAQQAYAGVVATALRVHARAGAADDDCRRLRAQVAVATPPDGTS